MIVKEELIKKNNKIFNREEGTSLEKMGVGQSAIQRTPFQQYEMIIESKPWVKTIIEDILLIVPRYRLDKIDIEENRISMWISKFGSMGIYFRRPEEIELLLKHKVSIQVPGNQEYGFSLSIND
jgi:hypothetical protein